MASMQCHKPANEACHGGHSEHRFSEKVKEMTSSVTKMFGGSHHVHHGSQMPTSNGCPGSGMNHSQGGSFHQHHHESRMMKAEGHCMPKMGENRRGRRSSRKNRRNGNCADGGSDSDSCSSSNSEGETCGKRWD
ncbi:hypothetical protein NMG60_11026966 [Bertholletia excelsa]